MSKIQLIVGLGNPGQQYQKTRHNAGVWFVEAIAEAYGHKLRDEKRFQSLMAEFLFPITFEKVILLCPQTYMNLSGQAVAAVAKYYHLLPENILVVHDELDLPPGVVKLKWGGGHAGHNGLKDIMDRLGTKDFWRLRIGIDRPSYLIKQPVVDYVLGKPAMAEKILIDEGLDKAIGVLSLLCEGHMEKATQQLHT